MEKEIRVDERIEGAVNSSQRLDANGSIYFAKELTVINARAIEARYPEFTALNIFPISTEGGDWATSIDWYTYDGVGYAKIISDYADDLPRVDVVGQVNNSPIKDVGDSYAYSYREIAASNRLGKNLPQRKANMARRAIDAKINRVAFQGDPEHNLVGILTNPDLPEYVLPADGTGGSTAFANKTAEQMVRDANAIVQSVVDTTNGVGMPDTMLMPPSSYSAMTTKTMPNTDTTALKFFLANNGYINRVLSVQELSTANGGGNTIIVGKFDPEHIELSVPVSFYQAQPQAQNFHFNIPCQGRTGGILLYLPLEFAKAVGA